MIHKLLKSVRAELHNLNQPENRLVVYIFALLAFNAVTTFLSSVISTTELGRSFYLNCSAGLFGSSFTFLLFYSFERRKTLLEYARYSNLIDSASKQILEEAQKTYELGRRVHHFTTLANAEPNDVDTVPRRIEYLKLNIEMVSHMLLQADSELASIETQNSLSDSYLSHAINLGDKALIERALNNNQQNKVIRQQKLTLNSQLQAIKMQFSERLLLLEENLRLSEVHQVLEEQVRVAEEKAQVAEEEVQRLLEVLHTQHVELAPLLTEEMQLLEVLIAQHIESASLTAEEAPLTAQETQLVETLYNLEIELASLTAEETQLIKAGRDKPIELTLSTTEEARLLEGLYDKQKELAQVLAKSPRIMKALRDKRKNELA